VPHPLRLELLRRARDGYRQHGRGYIVLRHDRNTLSYSTAGELEQLLADDEPGADGLLQSTANTVASYDPETEAVVVNVTPEGAFLLQVSASFVAGIDEIIFSRKRDHPG
jgi:hypothetical protein